MEENPRIRFSELRASIYSGFREFEDFSSYGMHPNRNRFYGATDALHDTIQMLRSAKSLHAKSNHDERKLIAYGILNALYVQQDSVKILAEVISKDKINMKGSIRTLRNRLAGHPAYTDREGGTSSIPASQMEAGILNFQIYGLSEDNKKDRFYSQDIDELIVQNYLELIPRMEKIYSDLEAHLKALQTAKSLGN